MTPTNPNTKQPEREIAGVAPKQWPGFPGQLRCYATGVFKQSEVAATQVSFAAGHIEELYAYIATLERELDGVGQEIERLLNLSAGHANALEYITDLEQQLAKYQERLEITTKGLAMPDIEKEFQDKYASYVKLFTELNLQPVDVNTARHWFELAAMPRNLLIDQLVKQVKNLRVILISDYAGRDGRDLSRGQLAEAEAALSAARDRGHE